MAQWDPITGLAGQDMRPMQGSQFDAYFNSKQQNNPLMNFTGGGGNQIPLNRKS